MSQGADDTAELRRETGQELNKGEARNNLARVVFIHRLGEIRDCTYENQQHRASGLNLLVTVIVLWNTRYLERDVAALRQTEHVPGHLLAHLSPLGWQRESAQVFVAEETARDIYQLARQMARGEVRAASVAWARTDELRPELRQRDGDAHQAPKPTRQDAAPAARAGQRDPAREYWGRTAQPVLPIHFDLRRRQSPTARRLGRIWPRFQWRQPLERQRREGRGPGPKPGLSRLLCLRMARTASGADWTAEASLRHSQLTARCNVSATRAGATCKAPTVTRRPPGQHWTSWSSARGGRVPPRSLPDSRSSLSCAAKVGWQAWLDCIAELRASRLIFGMEVRGNKS